MVCAGSAACVADILTFPFDVAKVRLQVQVRGGVAAAAATPITASITALNGSTAVASLQAATAGPQFKGLFGTMYYLARVEGPKSLYGGIGPGLQRQCIFASLRIGFYDSIKEFYSGILPFSQSNYSAVMATRLLAGVTSGAVAISVAQPTDVVKVRMQAKSGIQYRNSMHAYQTIYRTEGLAGLWSGLGPNVARNSIVNAAELVCYDTIKDLLMRKLMMRDNLGTHFTAAFSAGFVATVVASPIDVIKTRMMNSQVGTYTGMLDCGQKLFKENGLAAFYKGFTPSFMRMGTWNVVMFVTYEQLKKLSADVHTH
jgi:solute carrier family 25 uncoupling protein 8/9